MLELADTTFRAYRKKRGGAALHLRGRLLIHTDASFRLSAYLKTLRCWITLPGHSEIECDSVAYSEHPLCKFDGRSMLHDFWATALLQYIPVKDCVADLRLMYHFSFSGHPSEEPLFLERRVPVIRCFSYVSRGWPNQAIQPTAGRRTAPLAFIKTRSLQSARDPASGG
jgi:hypothetical protein